MLLRPLGKHHKTSPGVNLCPKEFNEAPQRRIESWWSIQGFWFHRQVTFKTFQAVKKRRNIYYFFTCIWYQINNASLTLEEFTWWPEGANLCQVNSYPSTALHHCGHWLNYVSLRGGCHLLADKNHVWADSAPPLPGTEWRTNQCWWSGDPHPESNMPKRTVGGFQSHRGSPHVSEVCNIFRNISNISKSM